MDGEVFSVKISPVWNGAGTTAGAELPERKDGRKTPKALPPGAVVYGMAGLVLSIDVKAGDSVKADDPVAMIEAMKMRRHVNSPRSGVVNQIWGREGEIVEPQDLLIVVEKWLIRRSIRFS